MKFLSISGQMVPTVLTLETKVCLGWEGL